MDSREGVLDATLVPLGLLILLAYQVFWFWRVRNAPLRTVLGVNHLARRYWVESIMKDNDKKNILAVQTLRNNIMGSTLMATTAILLCSATAVFMSSAYFSSRALLMGGHSSKLLSFKYLSLIACFLFSFVSYMQSIRYVNHVNFLVNIPLPEAMAIRVSPEYVANVLAKGCNFFTAGTRGFYFAFPLLLWLFSPIAVLCSCIALVPLLYYLDASDLDSDDEFLRKNSITRIGPPRALQATMQTGPNLRSEPRTINISDGITDEYWSSNSDIILKMRSATQELGR
ncbi:hypothetical protein M758_8G109000 [Ceratodon purpureus]|nr:hypothetical protein M758_8G109000 [Ceratodon purpureus]